MNQKIRAIYRSGSFIPHEPCDLPNDSEVNLSIEGPIFLPAKIVDRGRRVSVLRQITERMRRNPVPANAPRLTRDELHGRS